MARLTAAGIAGSGLVALFAALACTAFADVERQGQSSGVPVEADYIRNVLESQHSFPGVFIQSRSQPDSPHTFLVQVQVVPQRGVRTTILSPISHQGVVSFDDFNELHRYYPDRRLVEIGSSYYRLQATPRVRSNLIARNYSVTVHGDEVLANRRCKVVLCRPKSESLPSRRMYVDAYTNSILQYEIGEPGKRFKAVVTTRSADYSRANALRNFDLKYPARETTVVREWGPVDFSNPRSVSDRLGFTPRVPRVLSHGFVVQRKQIVGSSSEPYARLFLSDGLASVFIYQVRNDRRPRNVPRFERRPVQTDSGGVAYYAEGDVSFAVLRSLIEQIVDQH